MTKFFIIAGVLLIIFGILWPFIRKLGLGSLPGDIVIRKGSFGFYFPIMTCIIISVVLSLILWFFNR